MSMQQPPTPPAPQQGLPPVEPPSAALIVRLFLVPGIIVAILVALFLVGPYIYSGARSLFGLGSAEKRTADAFLIGLDSTNPDIRYRAASDLAQVLLRDTELASNAGFALDLADRLDSALARTASDEKQLAASFAGLSEGERLKEVNKLDADRKLITYLIGSLGHCIVPSGATQLCKIAEQTGDMERVALSERRGLALFALATLGEKTKHFAGLDDAAKEKILSELRDEVTDKKKTPRSIRAELCLQFLEGKPTSLGVPAALEKCADDDDAAVRLYTAFAAVFWTGTADEQKKIEALLVKLANDDGRGEDALEERRETNQGPAATREVTKVKGFTIQANATTALARRGSDKVRMELMKTLLTPDDLRDIFVLRSKTGDTPNEALVVQTVLSAVTATGAMAKKNPVLARRLEPQLKELVEAKNASVSDEARKALLAFPR